jgi:predicted phage terminase large subunit-like protein
MPTKSEIAQELLTRRKSRDNLTDFCHYVYPNYESPWHAKLLCEKLEAVERGEIKRLIINCPPRHSKSLHASVLFPSWFLGRHPEKLIVQAGYAADIAQKMSQDARRIITSAEYDKLYPNLTAKLTKDLDSKNSVREWQSFAGGGYYACGVGGALVGRGCDLLLIDDPFKSREDANSELKRERVIDWFKSVAYTRLMPNAAIIIINTRWHVDDLVGQILKQGAEEWEVLSLPAIKEDSYECLWEERYNAELLSTIKETIGLREWSAQYLQEPVIEGGNRFKCDDIKIVDESEFPNVQYIRAWDLASTAKQRDKRDPDYTVGVLGAIVKDNRGLNHFWIKEIVRGRWEAPERDNIIKKVADRDGARVPVYLEGFASYVDTYNHVRRVLAGRNIIRKSRLAGDKSVKAAGLEPIFENGNVHMVKAVWNDALVSEFMNFPSGSHDDIVDACSIIYGESAKSKSRLMMV